MNRPRANILRSASLFVLTLVFTGAGSPTTQAQDISETIAEAAGIPNIPALLPDRYTVAKSKPLPIDGVYMISSIRKKIRIEKGRAFALDPWLHMFVLKVQPDMVVMQNFRRQRPGLYVADDLPLLGPATMRLERNGDLDVVVQGKFGPMKYTLIKLEEQYPDILRRELQATHQSSTEYDDAGFGDDTGHFDDDYFGDVGDNDNPDGDEEFFDDDYDDDGNSDDDNGSPSGGQPEIPDDCVPINIDPITKEVTCA